MHMVPVDKVMAGENTVLECRGSDQILVPVSSVTVEIHPGTALHWQLESKIPQPSVA